MQAPGILPATSLVHPRLLWNLGLCRFGACEGFVTQIVKIVPYNTVRIAQSVCTSQKIALPLF